MLRLTGSQPFDNRIVVNTLVDLLSLETFGITLYNGILIYVVDEQKLYMLIDKTNSTSEEGWIVISSGNSYSYVEAY